ncbi:unnamed protein product [Periconia digitata]|uniref:Uncharacterized protein n=1 Tax=Periconia digitata TaxID=1303443 RepID=A0A9W4XVX7_9PLEO|nr:unnamed protein product [Periconia digitata]
MSLSIATFSKASIRYKVQNPSSNYFGDDTPTPPQISYLRRCFGRIQQFSIFYSSKNSKQGCPVNLLG